MTYDDSGKTPCEASSLVMEASKKVAISVICVEVNPDVLTLVVNCPVLVTFDTVASVDVPRLLEFTDRLVTDRLPPDDSV